MENRDLRKEKREAKRKKKITAVICAAAAIALICGAAAIAIPMLSPPPQPALNVQATPSAEPEATPGNTPPPTQSAPEPSPTPKQMLPEMKELYDLNSDLAGWVKIEGTKVDYPVMYTPQDGEYYMYRTFEKENDPTKQGCIILDKNCTTEPRSTNLLLHGHNMKNGTMFHTLIEYKDEDFYKEHPVIEYRTLYEKEEYEIVSVFLSKIYNVDDEVFKFYKFFNADTKAEFDEFINNCRALELYDTGVTAQFGDELLTLTTCEYSTANGRMVVLARKK